MDYNQLSLIREPWLPKLCSATLLNPSMSAFFLFFFVVSLFLLRSSICYLVLKMTITMAVETSVTANITNILSQGYFNLDDWLSREVLIFFWWPLSIYPWNICLHSTKSRYHVIKVIRCFRYFTAETNVKPNGPYDHSRFL